MGMTEQTINLFIRHILYGCAMDMLLSIFGQYYGLDWIALCCGVSGTWLLTNRNRIGFCLGALGCCAGFGAALLSGQFGFVVYNVILIAMMTRGFIRWGGNNMQAAE